MNEEIKSNIDQMGAKIFEYILETCDDKEAKLKFMELSNSFLTAAIDMDKPMDEIKKELEVLIVELYMKSVKAIEQIKAGNNEKIISEKWSR